MTNHSHHMRALDLPLHETKTPGPAFVDAATNVLLKLQAGQLNRAERRSFAKYQRQQQKKRGRVHDQLD
jgi:hypothetical protein